MVGDRGHPDVSSLGNALLVQRGILSSKEAQPVLSTLDPSNKTSYVTLSNGNLTATVTSLSSYAVVRSNTAKASGKWYLEMKNISGSGTGSGQTAFGLCNSSFSMGGSVYLGQDNNSIGWQNNSSGLGGPIYSGGSKVGNCNEGGDGFTNGDILALAVDVTNSLVWFNNLTQSSGWNTGSGSPSAGTGGISISNLSPVEPLYLCLAFYGTPTSSSVNFDDTTFTGTIPSGFSAWT